MESDCPLQVDIDIDMGTLLTSGAKTHRALTGPTRCQEFGLSEKSVSFVQSTSFSPQLLLQPYSDAEREQGI